MGMPVSSGGLGNTTNSIEDPGLDYQSDHDEGGGLGGLRGREVIKFKGKRIRSTMFSHL